VLSVETFVDCESLFASGRWLLGKPLVETAICLILERHAVLADMAFSAGAASDVVRFLAPLVEEQAITAAYLCCPTGRGGRVAQRELAQRWPTIPVSIVNDRVGTSLSSMPLIALLSSLAEVQTGAALIVSSWWDHWVGLRWPAFVPRLDADSRRR
jgi:hypothetical protein